MEELQTLERVQNILSFMEARGLTTSHQDSDRFLAHFLLFMVQPCGLLNMQKRFDLISGHMRKISPRTLEEAFFYKTEDQRQLYEGLPSSINLDDKLNPYLPKIEYESIAKIELDAMQRANSTLEDFCRSYFMFHGMDANDPHMIFRFLPMLSYTESYIYQLDTMNEKSLQSAQEAISPEGEANNYNVMKINATHSFDPLIDILQCQGLLTERIKSELQTGVVYWELERKLCCAFTGKQKILIEDVMRAIHLKSFDYRVLNLLLYQLTNKQVNDLHMEFLSVSEFLVEVADDLYDYEDDVMENSFNILRMFIGVYGASTAPRMLAKYIAEAEEKFEHLSKALGPELSLKYWRRCEEATKEGGTASGHAFGTWSIPPVIVDEDTFRLQAISRRMTLDAC